MQKSEKYFKEMLDEEFIKPIRISGNAVKRES
jgi:hypothetical protein